MDGVTDDYLIFLTCLIQAFGFSSSFDLLVARTLRYIGWSLPLDFSLEAWGLSGAIGMFYGRIFADTYGEISLEKFDLEKSLIVRLFFLYGASVSLLFLRS